MVGATGSLGEVPTLEIDGLAIHYEIHGDGPAILIPWCNFPWSSLDPGLLAAYYTVAVVSPRGYGLSGRSPTGYSVATIRSDLEAVLDHLSIDEYVPFGYSMTGSVAAWLGHANRRVRAVVSGGFPTATSYAAVLPRILTNLAETKTDPDRWKALTSKFDPDALLAWYRELDSIPAGGLVDKLDCPVYSYWAGSDEVIEELVGLETLQNAMLTRRLPFEVIPEMDHEGLLNSINVAMPGVLKWLHHAVPPGK
jgi:pimeloyl-ACP methyl ester carboxylesterase